MGMYGKAFVFCGAAALTLLATLPAQSTAATVATLDEMTLAADVIVLGDVVRVHAVDALRVVEVAPKRTIKGTVDGKKLFYLAPAAGSYGVEPAVVGETALLFLKKSLPPPGYTKKIKGIAGEAPVFNLVLQTGRLPAVGAEGGDDILAVQKNVFVFPADIRPSDWSNSKAPSSTTHYALKPAVAHIQKVLQAAAKGAAPAREVTARRLSLHQTVAVEWECGRKCTISHEGESDVTVTSGEGSAVRVTDAGYLTARMRSPGSTEEESKTWAIVYRGTWYDDDATTAVISLIIDAEKCNEARTGGRGIGVKCGKTPPRMKLRCVVEKVPVLKKKPSGAQKDAGTPTDAWVCTPTVDMSSYPGTPHPWVFGAGGRLSTFITGGLHPETYYLIAP